MKKILLILILILNCAIFTGCTQKSINDVENSIENKDYIVDISYSAVYENENGKTHTLSIKKCNETYEIVSSSSDTISSCEEYFFWVELLTNDNFTKSLFKYNAKLDKVNEQLSFDTTLFVVRAFRFLLLEYGENFIYCNSEIITFSVKTNKNNDEVFLVFKFSNEHDTNNIVLSLTYSFNYI